MTPCHCSDPLAPGTAPFRWSRAEVANAHDHFCQDDPQSQRQYAQHTAIPRSTLGYWLRRDEAAFADPDLHPDLVAFLRCSAGEAFLRRVVLAALTTFCLQGACGLRLLGAFLRQTQLDRFVACSRGALHPLLAHLESDLAAFRDQHQPPLARQMRPGPITVVADEHFHGPDNCLVAIEPVSNFILVECYAPRRDANTWEQAIREGIEDMPVEVVQLTSDQATGLLCCAEKGLQVAHSPDLFHGQRDLLKPVLLPLQRPIQETHKQLQKAAERTERLDVPDDQPQSDDELLALIDAVRQQMAAEQRLSEVSSRKEEAIEQVRGIGDDYHPFDRHTGVPLTAQEVDGRLGNHLDRLDEVVRQAGLGHRASEAVNKCRGWVGLLVGCVGWFWGLAQSRVEDLELTQQQEQMVREKLLPGCYGEAASGRARSPDERERLKEMATRLKGQAWAEGGALSELSEEERGRLQRVARETAGLFSRSSSCVEGRNGRLSLQHHGHSRVSHRRLVALTVIHNYLVERSDGTTAAGRFFNQKPPDLFDWLLERLPDLPRPAKKRRDTAAQRLSFPDSLWGETG
jgi:Family of unknown function (DUF6399)